MESKEITDEDVLKDAVNKLTKLLAEDREWKMQKQQRDIHIQKIRAVIDLLTDSKPKD